MRKNLSEPSQPKEIEAFRPHANHAVKLALAMDAGMNKSEIINRCLDRTIDAVLVEMQGEMQHAFNRLMEPITAEQKASSQVARAALPKKKS